MKRVLAILMENQAGALSRVVGLFSQRGYNIESLIVAPTKDPSLSRLTMSTLGDEKVIQQITKQLNKLVDIIKVIDLTEEQFVDRELILIRMNAEPRVREEIFRIVDIFRAKIVDVGSDIYTIEITGDEGKIKGFLDLLKPLGIKEVVRSGLIAISRGAKSIN